MITRLDPKCLDTIRAADDASLLAHILQQMQETARDIAWLAAAIHELANRQSDIAERAADICKSGVWVYLPLVASGTVSSLALATFCGRDNLLALVAQLPIEEQERVSTPGAMFEVEVFNPLFGQNGQPQFDTRKFLPFLLPDATFPQVFDATARTVRDQAAQRAYLLANRKTPKVSKVKVPTIRIDAENMLIFVDNKAVRVGAIADAVAQLADDHPEVAAMFKRALRPNKTAART